MSLIRKMRKQRAVYWKRGAPDEFGGAGYEPPIEIMCRWVSHIGEVRNQFGQLMDSKATVYVDREMFLNDMLMEGPLDSGTTPASPVGNPLAFEIQGFEKIPTLKATETLYVAHL